MPADLPFRRTIVGRAVVGLALAAALGSGATGAAAGTPAPDSAAGSAFPVTVPVPGDGVVSAASLARLVEVTRVAPQSARSMDRLREGVLTGIEGEARAGRLERKRLPRIERIVERTYVPDALQASIDEALEDELRPGDADALIAFALTPLGQRALDEEDAHTSGDVEGAFVDFARTFPSRPDHAERLARAVEMERIIDFAEVQGGFLVDSQRAVLGGLALSLPAGAHPELEGMLAELDSVTETLADDIRELMTLQLAFLYENLSLDELDAMIEHIATPAARRFSAGLVRGMSDGLQRVSIAFGDRLGRSLSLATIDEEV